MKNISNRKKFIESEFPPENTNVYWIVRSEDGTFTSIREYINGKWIERLSNSSMTEEIPPYKFIPNSEVNPETHCLLIKAYTESIYGSSVMMNQLSPDEIKEFELSAALSEICGTPRYGFHDINLGGLVFINKKWVPVNIYYSSGISTPKEYIFTAISAYADMDYNVKHTYEQLWTEKTLKFRATWDDVKKLYEA